MKSKTAIDKRRKRPFILWVLCLLFIALAVLGWIRVQQAIQSWALEESLLGQFLPLYLTISGGLWGIAAIPATIGLFMRFQRARAITWGAALFYPLTYWLEKILLVKSPTGFTNWLFDVGVTILWLLLVGVVLYLPASQAYLKGENK